jgi:predicted protein tyrosine phosphatase
MLEHLKICGRLEVSHFEGKGFNFMISIGDSDDDFDGLRLPGIPVNRHFCLRFTDTEESTHPDAPTEMRLSPLFPWLDGVQESDGLLVHCTAGISRSPAVALLSLCYLFPRVKPLENMERVMASAEYSYIWPNPLVVRIGDALLGRDGKIVSAVNEWWFGQNKPPPDPRRDAQD